MSNAVVGLLFSQAYHFGMSNGFPAKGICWSSTYGSGAITKEEIWRLVLEGMLCSGEYKIFVDCIING